MSYADAFYISGAVLAVAAVATSFIGLRFEKFPGRMSAVVALGFVALIGVTATYSVLNGQEEAEHRAHELEHANEVAEHEEESPVPAEDAEPGREAPAGKEAGGRTTIALAASPTALAYDKKSLTGKAGTVTIAFTNPSALEHDVAIAKDGEEIAKSETITEGQTSVSTELEAGSYTFLCTVPGHAEAGMEGTLTVK